MTSSDIDSVCLEWTLNDFNNSCSDAVLDNTTDPGVCRGFASVCGLSLESTPCPKNSGRGIEKLLQDAAISYPDCHLNLAWKNLTDQMAMEDMKGLPRSVATGGLGQLMYTNGTLTPYEVWLCVWDEGCAQGTDDAFCFAFNENEEVFVPWGYNSELGLVRNQNVASRAAIASQQRQTMRTKSASAKRLIHVGNKYTGAPYHSSGVWQHGSRLQKRRGAVK